MLTPTEVSGLRTILEDLIDSDLFSLSETVTKKLITIQNRNDAVEAILSCVEKPSDLLKRQRVTKRVLFGYLRKIKHVISPESTKHDLVMMCLSEWKSTEKCQESDYSTTYASSTPASQPSKESSSFNNPSSSQGDWLITMGVEFVKWFFPMLNNLQGFGPEHFWTDCRLKGVLKTASEVKEVDLAGDFDVATFMSGLIMNDKFYFDANSNTESVLCEQDPHGLVKLVISGVVHRFSNCIGLFDCWFGLVRNPALDSWKIKIVQIKIEVTSMDRSQIMPSNPYLSICQTVSHS